MVKTILRVGPVFVDPIGDDQHVLCLDTLDTLPRFFVDSQTEFVPLKLYLRDHPERRGEVMHVLREKLG